jgi:hypothetical protein
MPRSVRFARALLWVQGAIWAWLAVSTTVTLAVMLIEVFTSHRTWNNPAEVIGWVAVAAGLTTAFATVKIRLARSLKNGHLQTRKTVIGIEIAMTCMGVLVVAGADFSGGMPADVVTLAAFTGGCLSLAAAIGLLRRPAREYFSTPHLAAHAEGDSDGGPSGLIPTSASIFLNVGAAAGAKSRYA